MADPILACVRTGTVYPMKYVINLRNAIYRYMPKPYSIICFTDQQDRCEGVEFIDIGGLGLLGLGGWWAKMILFSTEWRGQRKVIYLDLDTVLVNDIAPLAAVPGEFAICESFTRLAGNRAYPCKYNSSVMVIGGGMAGFVWSRFEAQREALLKKHERYGDQACIEELYGDAPFLQSLVPVGFFLNYRHLTMIPPKVASVINFGGANKPANCTIPWVQAAWK